MYADTGSSGEPRISLGIAFLSGYLKRNGFNTGLCYYREEEDAGHCLEMIRDRDIGLVAISSVTASFQPAKELIRRIKLARPDIFIVCGGAHVSAFPGELENAEGLDAVCLGYGEEALLELAVSLGKKAPDRSIRNLHFKIGGSIVKNALRPFPAAIDDYFPEDRELFYGEFKRKGCARLLEPGAYEEFIFCRGCPFDCTFCANHILKTLGSGSYLIYPKVSTCIGAIREARRARGFRGVNIHDDILTLNKPWFRDFARAYSKRIGLPFKCNTRIGMFDEETVRALKDAGCEAAIIGIESGNERIRNTVLNKTIGSNENIIRGFELFHKYGIRTHSQNMIGFPEETFESFYDTVKINARILPNTATLSVFYPYPATRLHDRAAAAGLLDAEPLSGTGRVVERESAVLKLPGFPKSRVEFYARNFKYMVRLESLTARSRALTRLQSFFYGSIPAQRAAFACLRLLDKLLQFGRGFSGPAAGSARARAERAEGEDL